MWPFKKKRVAPPDTDDLDNGIPAWIERWKRYARAKDEIMSTTNDMTTKRTRYALKAQEFTLRRVKQEGAEDQPMYEFGFTDEGIGFVLPAYGVEHVLKHMLWHIERRTDVVYTIPAMLEVAPLQKPPSGHVV